MNTFLPVPASHMPGADEHRYCARTRQTEVAASGPTIDRAFERAAEAMFALTADLRQVRPERTVAVSFIEAHEVRALVRWLNVLIEASCRHGIRFCEFHLQHEGARWWGCATGGEPRGRPARPVRLERVLPDGAGVVQVAGGCEVRCVVHCALATRARKRLAAHGVRTARAVSETTS